MLSIPISVMLLFALLMDLLMIRCTVGSVMGRCYLQNELFGEPKHLVLAQYRFRSYPDGTLNGSLISISCRCLL